MVQINFALKEVNCKIVYYGPGLSGKTTNLEVVHSKAPTTHVGELTSIATEGDRTLFFDFLPLSLGQVAGMNTKFQIYTVPGQVYYNSTRKLVLQGADGIVFVADSRRSKMDENLESMGNLEENLREYGMDLRTTALVIQYNKRDLPDVLSVEELQKALNKSDAPYFEAVAVSGEGVFPTLKKLSSMVLESLNRQQSSTAVRKSARDSGGARETVAVGAGRGAAAAGQGGGAAKGGAGRAAPPAARKGAVAAEQVEERVTGSPGVKPIQRRSPAAPYASAAGAAPAPAGQPAVVKMRQPVQIPRAREARKKSLAPRLIAIAAVLLVGAVATIYFSGIWKKFI